MELLYLVWPAWDPSFTLWLTIKAFKATRWALKIWVFILITSEKYNRHPNGNPFNGTLRLFDWVSRLEPVHIPLIQSQAVVTEVWVTPERKDSFY